MIRNVDGHNRHLIKAQLQSARREQRKKIATRTEQSNGQARSPPRQAGKRLRGWSDDEEDEEAQQQQHGGPSLAVTDAERDKSSQTASRERIRPSSDKRTTSLPPVLSKMDKYFSASYDPALDVNPEYSTDPKTGLIADGGWDTMLEHVQQNEANTDNKASRCRTEKGDSHRERDRHRRRREHDEIGEADTERKRRSRRQHEEDEDAERRRRRRRSEWDDKESSRHKHHRSHSSKDKDRDSPRVERRSRHHHSSDRHRHRHRRSSSSSPSSPSSRSYRPRSKSPSARIEPCPRVGSSAMDTIYAKRGAVREWDMGKDKDI